VSRACAGPDGSTVRETITCEPVRIATDGAGGADGFLLFAGGRLVAVITPLRQSVNGEAQDNWYLEAGFGPCAAHPVLVFRTPDEARGWVGERLAAADRPDGACFCAGSRPDSPAAFDLG
jgi:hypothetical protein